MTASAEVRRRTVRFAAALTAAAALACAAPAASPRSEEIPVMALTAGTHATTVAVTVSAPGSSVSRRVDLRVRDGFAEGAIRIEAGMDRVIRARAYDADGLVTHAGEITIHVHDGELPYAALPMAPRAGESPLALWLGTQASRGAPAMAIEHPSD